MTCKNVTKLVNHLKYFCMNYNGAFSQNLKTSSPFQGTVPLKLLILYSVMP